MINIIRIIEVIILLTLAIASDARTYKISNKIILLFLVVGFLTNFYLTGISGIVLSFYGAIIPVLLLFILYVLKMLGAGDIKLFSAIGSIMGLEFILFTISYSFVCGGIIALFLIIIRKNSKQRFQYLFNYLKSCFITFSLQPYTDFEDKSDGSKFRFSYAIACGTILNLVITFSTFSNGI